MRNASSTRSPAENPYSYPITMDVASTPGMPPVTPAGTGYAHLLRNHTVEGLLQAAMHDDSAWSFQMPGFLLHGSLPLGSLSRMLTAELALSFLSLREPALFLAVHDLQPVDVVISTREQTKTLLEAVQSRNSVSGLKISYVIDNESREAADVIQPLANAFKLNNGLKKLTIRHQALFHENLSLLFAELCSVPDLELTICFDGTRPADLITVGKFLDKNKEIHSLRFHGFSPESDEWNTAESAEAMASVMEGVRTQRQLKCLTLDYVSHDTQQALGEYIRTNRTLTTLGIGLCGPNLRKELLAGLEQNSVIQSLDLEVDRMDDSMLPLLELFMHNKCSATKLVLATKENRENNNDRKFISKLIAANTTLSSFGWHFDDAACFNVFSLASAIEKNCTLDSIEIRKREYFRVGRSHTLDNWVSEREIPQLLKQLAKNHVLTELIFAYRDDELFGKKMLPEIAGVLNRNLFYRTHVCSDGFIEGAACGFYNTLLAHPELGKLAAPYLVKQGPRFKVGALALVNKATWNWARQMRHRESIEIMKKALAPAESASEGSAKMHALLQRVLIRRLDYSNEELREIAGSRYLTGGILRMLGDMPEHVDYLLNCFVKVVGPAGMDDVINQVIIRRNLMASNPFG